MVKVHTRLPHFDNKRPTGEYIAAKWVLDNLDDEWHAWFQVNWLANVREMDQILAHPRFGVFVIEVKGHTIDQIVEFSADDAKYSNNQKGNPAVQAHRAKQQFATWLRLRSDVGVNQVPWLDSTAWFPRVTIREFQAKFDHPSVDAQADSMIFKDDNSAADFINALKSAHDNPPVGMRAKIQVRDFAVRVAWLIAELDASLVSEPSQQTRRVIPKPSSAEKKSGDSIADRAAKYSTPEHRDVVFAGGPGTGKTSTLLAIGRERARRGERVLYLTYNKVLAANFRAQLRDMSYEDQVNKLGPAEGWNVIALDLWDFYSRVTGREIPAKMNSARYQRWERKYGRLLKKAIRAGLEEFDAVLVDEIQDLSDVGLRFTFAARDRGAALYAGFGYGQSLYRRDTGADLLAWLERAERVELVRSFRASKSAHLVVNGFIEHGMNFEAAAKDIEKTSTADKLLMLANETPARGNADSDKAPGNIRLKKREGTTVDSNIYVWELHEFLREVKQKDGTYDAMILLRHVNNTVADACRQALRGGEIPFVDLLDEKNRRNMTPDGHVKLVTINSSRGLSAANVLVIGFDELGDNPHGHNLASIALSRATEQTVVVCATESTAPSVRMLRETLHAAVGAKKRPE